MGEKILENSTFSLVLNILMKKYHKSHAHFPFFRHAQEQEPKSINVHIP